MPKNMEPGDIEGDSSDENNSNDALSSYDSH